MAGRSKKQDGSAGQPAAAPEAAAGEGNQAAAAGVTVTGGGSGEALPPVEETGGQEQEAPAAEAPAEGGEGNVLAADGATTANATGSDASAAAPAPEAEDHVTAFDRRIERLCRIAEEAEFESGSLVGDIRDGLLDIFKARPKLWSQMSEGEQRDLARGLETIAKTFLRKAVIVIAEEDDVSVHATLKGYQVDGETFKLKVVAKGDVDTATELFKMDGHEVILIRADARRHYGQRKDPEVMPDAPKLAFSDPPTKGRTEPEHPADDSDLAGGEELTIVRDGDPIEHDGKTGVAQIDLESGMIELLVPDEGEEVSGTTFEVRAATPQELAAERERIGEPGEDEEIGPLDKLGEGESVDLKRGWIVREEPGVGDSPSTIVDVRAATPEEMAAERERQADFAG